MSTEQKMYDALKRISKYMSPDKMRRQSQKLYGLEPDEAIEMAYENVVQEAKDAIKGVRRPKASDARKELASMKSNLAFTNALRGLK